MKRIILAFLAFLLLGFGAASAQNLNNPGTGEFTASPDHAAISQYEIGWFLIGGTSPVSVLDIGKPTPDTIPGCSAPSPCIQFTFNVMPLPFNQYVAKVRGKAGEVYSDWSDPSNVFYRVPGKPGKPVIK
jgi:hypothetical protein